MSTEHKGEILKNKIDGKMLKDKIAEGDLLVSDVPTGNKLWKNKKKLNEKNNEPQKLNE